MLISGKTIANHIIDSITTRVHNLYTDKGVQPHLVVIQVGTNPGSSSYIAQKRKSAEKIGAALSHYHLPENVTQKELLETMDYLQHKTEEPVHGMLVQLPLPSHIDRDAVIAAIDPEKDVDGFTANSPYHVPVGDAVMYILATIWQIETQESRDEALYPLDERISTWLTGKKILVIGQGFTAGAPITRTLISLGFHPETMDEHTMHPEELIKNADVIVSCVGKKKIITSSMIKKDAILIGVGMNKDEEGDLFADYDVLDIEKVAKYFTPVPGGVGPVNIACLMQNLVTSAEKAAK